MGVALLPGPYYFFHIDFYCHFQTYLRHPKLVDTFFWTNDPRMTLFRVDWSKYLFSLSFVDRAHVPCLVSPCERACRRVLSLVPCACRYILRSGSLDIVGGKRIVDYSWRCHYSITRCFESMLCVGTLISEMKAIQTPKYDILVLGVFGF